MKRKNNKKYYRYR